MDRRQCRPAAPGQDQATLLRGFAQALPGLPAGARLAIRKGRLEGKLKALAGELGIAGQVDFLGQVPDARRYFRAFDVFALSSDHEPFGMVLLEAMVAGCRVGHRLWRCPRGGRGRWRAVPAGRPGQLAQGLEHMAVLDGQQRQACAEHMLQRLRERFSDQAVREAFWQPQVRALVGQG